MIKSKAYFESLDKRTTEFKNWKMLQGGEPHTPKSQEELNAAHEANSPIGAGDVLAAITKVTGIKALVDIFTPEGSDCGCDERKKAMNKLNFRGRKPLCLDVKEYDFLHEFYTRDPQEANATEAQMFRDIYGRVMGTQAGGCNGCMVLVINDLKMVYSTY